MQSTCLPSKIQVSSSTYSLVKDTFLFEDRGEIPVKGKGMMHTYFLTGRNNAFEHRMSSLKSIDGFTVLREQPGSKQSTESNGSSSAGRQSAQGSFLTQMIMRKSFAKAKKEGNNESIKNMKSIAEIEDQDEEYEENEEEERERERESDNNQFRKSESKSVPNHGTKEIELQIMEEKTEKTNAETNDGIIAIARENSFKSVKSAETSQANESSNPSSHKVTRTAADVLSIALGAFKSGLKEKPVNFEANPNSSQSIHEEPALQAGSHKSLKKAAISVIRQLAQGKGENETTKQVDLAVDGDWETHNSEVMMRTLKRKASFKRINSSTVFDAESKNNGQTERGRGISNLEQPNLFLRTESQRSMNGTMK